MTRQIDWSSLRGEDMSEDSIFLTTPPLSIFFVCFVLFLFLF